MDELDRKAVDDIVPGSNIRHPEKYKMCLHEAFFLDGFRDRLPWQNDYLSSTQMDARNSDSQRVRPFREVVCDEYDQLWFPKSKRFPLFHFERKDAFHSSFISTQKLTCEQTRGLLVEVRGRFTIVIILVVFIHDHALHTL